MIQRSTRHGLWFCASVSLAIIAILGPASAQNLAIEFTATADSYVESGASANTNFGLSPILEVGNNTLPVSATEEWTYVKFDTSTYTGPVTSATLELYGHHTGNGTSDIDTAYGVPNNDWTGLGITWNNKPVTGPELSAATITTTSQYYAFDVTSFLKTTASASRVYTFAVLPEAIPGGSVGPDVFDSTRVPPAQSVNPPVLIISSGT